MRLDDLLRGIAAVGELTPRTNGSGGERLANGCSSAHCGRGVCCSLASPATHVDARTCILTDSHYGKADAASRALIEAALLRRAVLPLVEAGKTCP